MSIMNWNFNAEEAVTEEFAPIPIGDHRVRIAEANEKVSKNGNQMIELVLDVSGHNSRLWHYIVFMPDNSKLTNQKLGQIFDSFGIPAGNLNIASWVGAVGAARIKHEAYNGDTSAKVHYFLKKDKQAELPPWQEPANREITHGGAAPVQQGAPMGNGFNQMPQGYKPPWES